MVGWPRRCRSPVGHWTHSDSSTPPFVSIHAPPSGWATDVGSAAFTAGRFEDAATALEKYVAEHPQQVWPARTARGCLRSSRSRGWRRSSGSWMRCRSAGGSVSFSQLLARVWIPYARPEDAARLRDGLRKAGVPEFPFDYPTAMERLADNEIRSALFGHTFKGRDIDSGAKWILSLFRLTALSPLPATAPSPALLRKPAVSSRSRMVSCAGGILRQAAEAAAPYSDRVPMLRLPMRAISFGSPTWIASVLRGPVSGAQRSAFQRTSPTPDTSSRQLARRDDRRPA